MSDFPSIKLPPRRWMLGCFGVVIVILLAFQAGQSIGFRKARFSYQWGDNYHRMFGGPRGGFMRDMMGRDLVNGHGTAGTIVKIDGSTLVIKGENGIEKMVTLTPTTIIRKGNLDSKLADLIVDTRVVIIGTPKDDGSIEAKIVRVFDTDTVPASMRPGDRF